MTLKTRLTDDMKTAMRNKDTLSLSTIRLVNAAIKQYEVDNRQDADDVQIIAILNKMLKQRKDSAQIYHDAARHDLAEKEEAEANILMAYLPQQLSTDELVEKVKAVIAQTGASSMGDMGKVMGVLKTQLAGQADMGQVNQLVKQHLSA